MSKSSNYSVLRIVPCECGSTDAYFHGPEDGLREYCCDSCWAVRHTTPKQRQTWSKLDGKRPVGGCP